MKAMLLLVVLGGCQPIDASSMRVRWPRHREARDEQVRQLQDEVAKLTQRITVLESKVYDSAPAVPPAATAPPP